MTQTFRELIIGGVLVAPILSYAVAAVAIIMMLRPILHFIRIFQLFQQSTDRGAQPLCRDLRAAGVARCKGENRGECLFLREQHQRMIPQNRRKRRIVGAIAQNGPRLQKALGHTSLTSSHELPSDFAGSRPLGAAAWCPGDSSLSSLASASPRSPSHSLPF